jgi:hypothetical protein
MTVARILGLVALGALCGCSLLLDTDEFRTDRSTELRVTEIDAQTLFEGATEPIIVHGEGLSESVIVNAAVMLDTGDEPVRILQKVVNGSGTQLGLLLEVPVLPDYDPPADGLTIHIELSRGDSSETRELAVVALPELEPAPGTLNTADIAERYSEITVSGDLRLEGTAPARLVATSVIRISGVLSANGQDGSNDAPGAGGPGGCAGGAGGRDGISGQDGACETGGGRAGTGATGTGPGGNGGGGGCARNGVTGADLNGGNGGDGICSDALVPLGMAGNQGHGGGGGGAFESASGGGGGGGGGVIELTASRVVLNRPVEARGGNGARGVSFECTQPRYAGAGGGGSGGVVMVRADTLVATGTDRISIVNGVGPHTCDGEGTGGGDGSPGWIRLDVASLESDSVPDLEYVADLFSRDHIWQGPRLVPTPRLIVGSTASFVVTGDPAETYRLQLDGGQEVAVGGNQPEEIAVEPGLHEICALVQGDNLPLLPETQHCLTIAVLDR